MRLTEKQIRDTVNKMEMKQEMMGDAIDAGLDTADDVEAADKVYAQICDEIGVELADENEVGKSKLPSKAAAVSNISLN